MRLKRKVARPVVEVRRRLTERRLANFYATFVSEGSLCFDVGANVGTHSAALRRLGTQVVAIEPQAQCVQILSQRFSEDPSVTVVNSAVSSHPGVTTLHICRENPVLSTVSDRWKNASRFANSHTWNETTIVQCTTLAALIETYGRPTFCKIDVEGHELEVIRGLNQTVQVLSFEYTAELADDTAGCIHELERLGSWSFNASSGSSLKMLFDTWTRGDQFLAHLSSVCATGDWGDIYARCNR